MVRPVLFFRMPLLGRFALPSKTRADATANTNAANGVLFRTKDHFV